MQTNFKQLIKVIPEALVLIAIIVTIMTWVNMLTFSDFGVAWVRAFLFAIVTVLPIGGLMFLALHQLICRVFSNWPAMLRNLLNGVILAVVLESIMALTTTASIQNFHSVNQFFDLYISSFLYALPVGLLYACITATTVNFKVEQEFLDQVKRQ